MEAESGVPRGSRGQHMVNDAGGGSSSGVGGAGFRMIAEVLGPNEEDLFNLASIYERVSPSELAHRVVDTKGGAPDIGAVVTSIVYDPYVNEELVKELSVKRFKQKLSGRGLVVKNVSSGRVESAPKMMRYMGKHIYISSMNGTVMIAVDSITTCVADGKVLTIKTIGGLDASVRMPSRADAMAIGNVLGGGLVV